MPHRILHIIPTLDRAGAEKQLSLLALGLPRTLFDVHVCALTRGGPWQQSLEAGGVPVTVIGKQWKFDPLALRRLYQTIRAWRPDIVHTWIFAGNCYGRVAARWAQVPHIVAAERCVDLWKTWHELAIDRWLARRTDAIVVNSAAIRDFYGEHGVAVEKFAVIPNAIAQGSSATTVPPSPTLREELHLPADAQVMLTVGRLWPQKRVKDLIWAADLLKGVRSDTHLVIVGDGPQRYALERYRHAVQIADRVHFLGHREDVPALLRQAQCFWLGSGYEGQSNAIMEAMTHGLPVVATDIPGNRDLIVDGVSGYLVPVGDSAAFARRTQLILHDMALAQRLGQAASQRMQTLFGVENMVARYVELYQRILSMPPQQS